MLKNFHKYVYSTGCHKALFGRVSTIAVSAISICIGSLLFPVFRDFSHSNQLWHICLSAFNTLFTNNVAFFCWYFVPITATIFRIYCTIIHICIYIIYIYMSVSAFILYSYPHQSLRFVVHLLREAA